VNDKITCIPDNEMLLIITQEFHNTKWWVGSQYQQDNIPFPSKNITGEIYELTIE
jgi:vancomycin permeability regulator SanA